ncbi:Phosphomannomutase [methanotrophic endosymbiont of Bathymodiolus azoricus (Menez Gwen)]|jgi:phosphomannomutase|nr:Phosphomannomutase [methanotrophic endosymbiont of Bathymodiolus azoricus (Menez Gwen)]
MQAMTSQTSVVGYEANGGFLQNTPIQLNNKTLAALPTRDAVIVPLCLLLQAKQLGCSISALLKTLPPRFTYSDRIKNFPSELSQSILGQMQTGELTQDAAVLTQLFTGKIERAVAFDYTDGVRITLANDEVVHFRGSGNAPELRCYTEADSDSHAEALNQLCIKQMHEWKP